MPGKALTATTRIVSLLIVLGVLGCGSSGPGRKKGPSSKVERDLKTTKVGRAYVGKRVVVTAVDRSRLVDGAVAIRIRNKTDEFLPDLGYEVTLYYENPDGSKRASQPYLPETTKKRRLDLDSNEEATITVRPGELSPGAADVFLRLRAERPEPTKVGDTFLSESVRVLRVERDWFSSSPKASFEIRNDWDNPLRLYYRVQLIKDGKPVGQTEWKKAPGVLEPGATMVLEANLKGKRVVGTYPALKIRRANI